MKDLGTKGGPKGTTFVKQGTGNSTYGVVLESELSRACYYAGDIVEARVSFVCPRRIIPDGNETDASLDTDTDVDDFGEHELLEWATVQAHGHVSFDPQLVSPSKQLLEQAQTGESFSYSSRSNDGVLGANLLGQRDGSLYNSMKTSDNRLVHRSTSGIHIENRPNPPRSWEDISQTGSMPNVAMLGSKTGFCIFASPPEVLVCAKKAKHGQTYSYMFRLRLPDELPPTYKGTSVRHWYLLTVGAKLASNKCARVLHVPIRILGRERIARPVNENGNQNSTVVSYSNERYNFYNLQRNGDNHNYELSSWSVEEFMKKTAFNPPKGCDSSLSFSSIGLRVLDTDYMGRKIMENYHTSGLQRNVSESEMNTAGEGRSQVGMLNGVKIFKIGSEESHMAKLTMYRQSIAPGETLLVSLDFQDAKTRCAQVTVGIETEEKRVQPPPLRAAFVPLTAKLRARNSNDPMGSGPWRRTIATEHAVVPTNMAISLKLYIPADTTPDFSTDLVTVRSFLRFEFVTVRKESSLAGDQSDSNPGPINPITNSSVQICPWRIPLSVIPPTSFHSKTTSVAGSNENVVRTNTMLEMNSIGVTSGNLRKRVWL